MFLNILFVSHLEDFTSNRQGREKHTSVIPSWSPLSFCFQFPCTVPTTKKRQGKKSTCICTWSSSPSGKIWLSSVLYIHNRKPSQGAISISGKIGEPPWQPLSVWNSLPLEFRLASLLLKIENFLDVLLTAECSATWHRLLLFCPIFNLPLHSPVF